MQLQPYGNMINPLVYEMLRRKSCGFVKVFMLKESVAKGNIIKSPKQCELFNIMYSTLLLVILAEPWGPIVDSIA